ncbi:bile acid:sodium symporter family protein [Wolinella succinogenes]|uniref:bile acid:sodium symporter family protein n=1 Tax=Wolinella succinogenes TaxID=844 RepID=UPI002FCAD043
MDRINALFPLWAILFSALAYAMPSLFVPLKEMIVPLLGFIMFCMGMTLLPKDFKEVVRRPKVIALGIVLQFTLMPLGAYVIAHLLGFPALLIAGFILVGTAPGGTASNVMAFLAKGDVALSITLTACSTLLGVILTPYLTLFLTQEVVEVNALAMLMSIVKIVFFPVALGVGVNYFLRQKVEKVQRLLPTLSIVGIVLIIAIVVALNQSKILEVGAWVALGVVMHNTLGLVLGYFLSKMAGFEEKIARTIAIEVGMQNSGLAVALAAKYFGALAALPGAIFSVWHNVSGSLIASYWGSRSEKEQEE